MSTAVAIVILTGLVFGLTAANLTLAILFFRHIQDHEQEARINESLAQSRTDRRAKLRRYCSTYHRWPINR